MNYLSLILFIPVELITCDKTQFIVEKENEIIEIDFFNLIFYSDENRINACLFLENSENIELEEEKLAQNAYYIYTDGKLFQEIAIENDWAKVNLNYPDYLYRLEKDEMVVSTNTHIPNTKNHSILLLSGLFLLSLFCLFIFVLMSKM